MIEYPDVSRYTPNVDLTPYAGVCARAGMSDGSDTNHPADMHDPSFAVYQQRAKDAGKLFTGYHWPNHGNAKACAQRYFSIAGTVPAMIDGEDVAGNSGYNGPLTVQDFLDFHDELAALGGSTWGAYLPQWYWSGHMGKPNLIPIQDAGMALVASNYSTSTFPGPYGGVQPLVWQHTSSPYDKNYYQGDAAELAALWKLDTIPVPIPPQPQPGYETLLVDGVWGTRTTSRLQQFAGTPVDGQLSPGVGQSSCTRWLQEQLNAHGFRDEFGRHLVVDADGLSFLPQDGHKTHSIAALERAMLGMAHPDCYLSMPSSTVKELQRRLNANHLF